MNSAEESLCAIGRWLHSMKYEFVAVSEATRRRVNDGAQATAFSLRGVFGWNREFQCSQLPREILELMTAAGVLETIRDRARCTVSFSSLLGELYVHAAGFGPDAYRYCALLEGEIKSARRIVEVGAGPGGLSLARVAKQVVLVDRAAALALARVNAALAKVEDRVELIEGDGLSAVRTPFDVVIANAPSAESALRIVGDAMERLHRPGRLVLYTSARIVDGEDRFRAAVSALINPAVARTKYREIDPDVACETPERAEVDRVAAVALAVEVH